MSFSISFKVVDGQVDPDSIQASSGGAAPPDGSYSINGHVHHEYGDGQADAQPMVGVMTPMGGVNAYFNEAAYKVESQ